MKDIKLFITDIDGVWTDGGMYYDETGNEFKKFNTADSAGVLFLHLMDLPVAIITGEVTNMVKRRSEKLKVDYLFMGAGNKLEVASKLCADLGITLKQVAYIGDDVNDILLLKKVGLSAAPDNAPDYVKEIVNWIIPVKGGNGAFRAFVEKYLKEMNLLESTVEKFILNDQSLKQ
jgi:3-deoxy-D-manno-octulosonate 8-phosphate phosphatase (KDO 8-P phosphatase)